MISKIGQGGMGAVYRATDTKLNRDVAIKVFPPAFAEYPARMQRFEREAQVLASLNHPNIRRKGCLDFQISDSYNAVEPILCGHLP